MPYHVRWPAVSSCCALATHHTITPNYPLITPPCHHSYRYEYLWEDGVKFKRPTKLPAPEYVDALMNWAQNILDDESTFPNKIGVPFPRNFRETVRTIVRRLFRVYAHIYSNHFDQICALGIEGTSLEIDYQRGCSARLASLWFHLSVSLFLSDVLFYSTSEYKLSPLLPLH